MVTIYGGIAPAPPLPEISLGGGMGGYPRKGRITLMLFFNAARDDDLAMVDIALRLRREEEGIDLLGIHCPRFPAERDTRRLLSILDGIGVDFPVYDDSSKSIRKAYLINGWPAVVMVDPEKSLAWAREGVVPIEAMRPVLRTIAKTARSVGSLVLRADNGFKGSPCDFLPLKLSIRGESMTILDGKKNRLIFAKLDGSALSAKVEMSVDLGDRGRSSVTGFCLGDKGIFLSDRRGRSVRMLDPNGRESEVFSGDSSSSRLMAPRSFGYPRDVAFFGGLLYIASAGSRQIWVQSLSGGGARPFAGTGEPGMDDGSPQSGTIGYPETMIADRGVLFFSDSYSSSIRWVDSATGEIGTIAGEGPSLYGCRDGDGSQALFQRPMGLCLHEGLLHIADSYNDRIRTIDLSTGKTSTLYGAKRWQRLFSPSDIAFFDGRFYVADFGNGRIVSFDEKKGEPEALNIAGL